MWTAYKKEIMAREKEEKDFLKNYYQHSHKQHANQGKEEKKKTEELVEAGDNTTAAADAQQGKTNLEAAITEADGAAGLQHQPTLDEEEDWPVQVRGCNCICC